MSMLHDFSEGVLRHFLDRVGTEHVKELKTAFEDKPLITDDVIFQFALLVREVPIYRSSGRRGVRRRPRKRWHFGDKTESLVSHLPGRIGSPRRRVPKVVVDVTFVKVEPFHVFPIIIGIIVVVVTVGRSGPDLVLGLP